MKFEFEINDEILQDDGFTEFDVKMIIGAALYNAGVTSTGKASEILGLDRRTFLDEMGKYGGVLMKMSIEEVIRDCEIASRF